MIQWSPFLNIKIKIIQLSILHDYIHYPIFYFTKEMENIYIFSWPILASLLIFSLFLHFASHSWVSPLIFFLLTKNYFLCCYPMNKTHTHDFCCYCHNGFRRSNYTHVMSQVSISAVKSTHFGIFLFKFWSRFQW